MDFQKCPLLIVFSETVDIFFYIFRMHDKKKSVYSDSFCIQILLMCAYFLTTRITAEHCTPLFAGAISNPVGTV